MKNAKPNTTPETTMQTDTIATLRAAKSDAERHHHAGEAKLSGTPLVDFHALAAARADVAAAKSALESAAAELASAEQAEAQRAAHAQAQRAKALAEQAEREREERRAMLDAELATAEAATRAEMRDAAAEIARIKAQAEQAVEVVRQRGRAALASFNELHAMVTQSATERGELPPAATKPIHEHTFAGLVTLHRRRPGVRDGELLTAVCRELGISRTSDRVDRFWSPGMQLDTLTESETLFMQRKLELEALAHVMSGADQETMRRLVAGWHPEESREMARAESDRLRKDLAAARERDFTFIGEEAQARSIAELERRLAKAEAQA